LSFPLYFDEDFNPLVAAMLEKLGFDVLTTPQAGRADQGLSDEDQLAFATAVGRAIVSHNARDFKPVADQWALVGRLHRGILLSPKRPPAALAAGIQIIQRDFPAGIANHCLWLPPG